MPSIIKLVESFDGMLFVIWQYFRYLVMFCWGNMKNGELGLGGLEEEIITQPRMSPFALAKEVKKGISHNFCLDIRITKLNFILIFLKYLWQLAVEITIQF